jgi:hypothetical protein
MPEYEDLDFESLPDKTQEGGVKHNREWARRREHPSFDANQAPRGNGTSATMANDLLNQIAEPQTSAASTGGCELDLTFGVPRTGTAHLGQPL